MGNTEQQRDPETDATLVAESRPAAQTGSAPSVIDFDTPCLPRGYNLRGLTGDPVRCPECGRENYLGLGPAPEELIAKRLDKMEAPLTIAGAAIMIGVPFALICAMYCWEVLRGNLAARELSDVFACVGLPTTISLVVFVAATLGFRASCGAQAGWAQLFVRYQVVMGGIGVLLILGLFVAASIASTYPANSTLSVLPMLFYVVMLIVIPIHLPARRRHLMPSIHELQRETAIKRLREEALWRLPREKRQRL